MYNKLDATVGLDHISKFIESLVRPRMIEEDMEAGYRRMAEDEEQEAQALEWSEAVIGDIDDEAW